VAAPDAATLLAAFDECRGRPPQVLPDGVHVDLDGPLVRTVGRPHGGFVGYRDLGGLEGGDLDALIARQVAFFAQRGEPFEWKLHGHDLPRDLPERLRAAGFAPDPQETVMVAPVGAIAREVAPPAGVALRRATPGADLERIGELESRVWAREHVWLAAELSADLALAPEALVIVLAEAAGEVVSAAWMRLELGTPFARLYGGATLAEWRGRGIYRALVAQRAGLAARRGYRYLQVDASDDSRPILARLGFAAITTTTPFMWSPPGA
jgi:GNAT superfamily N-acetyltransferase